MLPKPADCPELRERAKRTVGRWLLRWFPRRAERIASATFIYDPSGRETRLDRLLRAGLADRCLREADEERLALYHANFWRGPCAPLHHAMARSRYETEFLAKGGRLLDALSRRLRDLPEIRRFCEIGTGYALILDDLARRFPTLDGWIGLDLSPEQVAINRRDFPNPKLEFVAADARTWIPEKGLPGTVFFTWGGVLEYFAPRDVRRLLDQIGRQLRPALVVLVEPVAEDHDVDGDPSSRPCGPEHSFSHPYPRLLAAAGFEVFHREELRILSVRMLALGASAV